jgi:hypothetical protein
VLKHAKSHTTSIASARSPPHGAGRQNPHRLSSLQGWGRRNLYPCSPSFQEKLSPLCVDWHYCRHCTDKVLRIERPYSGECLGSHCVHVNVPSTCTHKSAAEAAEEYQRQMPCGVICRNYGDPSYCPYASSDASELTPLWMAFTNHLFNHLTICDTYEVANIPFC